MLRSFAIAAVAALLHVSVAAAQPPLGSGGRGSFPGCPKCGVYGFVDYPKDGATVVQSAFTAGGWGIEGGSGAAVDRIDVWYQDYAGAWIPVRLAPQDVRTGFIHRWDVVLWGAANDFGLVDLYSGWAVTIRGVPLGLRRLKFLLWRGPYVEEHNRVYLVKARP